MFDQRSAERNFDVFPTELSIYLASCWFAVRPDSESVCERLAQKPTRLASTASRSMPSNEINSGAWISTYAANADDESGSAQNAADMIKIRFTLRLRSSFHIEAMAAINAAPWSGE